MIHSLCMLGIATICALRFFDVGLHPANAGTTQHQPSSTLKDFATITPVDPEDLGSVPPNQLATRRIRINNVGERPFTVSLKSKTCSCVGVDITSPTLEPRESTAVSINIQTIASVEPQMQSVVFELTPDSVDAPAKAVRVDLRYTPEIEFIYNPTRILRKIRLGDTIESTIYIRSVDNLGPEITKLTITPEWLSATINPGDPTLPNVSTITVSGTPAKQGAFSGELTITAGPSKQTNTIPIRVFAGQPLSVLPSSLFVYAKDSSSEATIKMTQELALIGRQRDFSKGFTARSNCDCVVVRVSEPHADPEVFWESAELFRSRISLELTVSPRPPETKVRLIELVNDRGDVLASIPILDRPITAPTASPLLNTPKSK